MKSSMLLRSYVRDTALGTFSLKEVNTMFGGKMIDIEDNIIINNASIQYSEQEDGYQFYNKKDIVLETYKIVNLNNVKEEYHDVSLNSQSNLNLKYNTVWRFTLNTKNIIEEYLFGKLKERRTFKAMKSEYFLNSSINVSIRDYIALNLFDRYKFKSVDFYVNYQNIITEQTPQTAGKFQYNPIYDPLVKNKTNLTKDLTYSMSENNFSDVTKDVVFFYTQKKPSDQYKFNYYFDIYFEKI